jgi:aspartyl/asparaginyl-tRNA synthetase
MERDYISEVLKGKKSKVFVKGWVYDSRDLSKIRFLVLRDVSGIVQVTGVKGKTPEKVFDVLDKIPKESVIEIEGKVVASKQAPGGYEINPEKLDVLAEAESPLPIDISDFSKTDLDKRLDWRSLSLRSKKSKSIFKIQGKIIQGMQDWLNSNGYYQIFTPSLMGIAAESGSEVFEVKYFDKKAFLRQDPQLHRQLTIAGGIEKIYDIGPSWRAEKSHTVRHLCEHRTCAVELAFIDSEYDVMRVEEQVIISAFKRVNEDCKKE